MSRLLVCVWVGEGSKTVSRGIISSSSIAMSNVVVENKLLYEALVSAYLTYILWSTCGLNLKSWCGVGEYVSVVGSVCELE